MADCYALNPERSRFTVQAFASGMLSGFAHSPTFNIRKYAGEMCFSPSGVNSTCQIAVEADSLEVTGNASEKDRQEITRQMRDEVLEVGQFPKIAFNSTEFVTTKITDNWFRVQMRGELQLHGMKIIQPIDSQLRIVENELRLSGEFPLSLTEYKMKRVSALAGMIQLKDQIKFAFDFVFLKKDSPQ